jgi:hypothetical protein
MKTDVYTSVYPISHYLLRSSTHLMGVIAEDNSGTDGREAKEIC